MPFKTDLTLINSEFKLQKVQLEISMFKIQKFLNMMYEIFIETNRPREKVVFSKSNANVAFRERYLADIRSTMDNWSRKLNWRELYERRKVYR